MKVYVSRAWLPEPRERQPHEHCLLKAEVIADEALKASPQAGALTNDQDAGRIQSVTHKFFTRQAVVGNLLMREVPIEAPPENRTGKVETAPEPIGLIFLIFVELSQREPIQITKALWLMRANDVGHLVHAGAFAALNAMGGILNDYMSVAHYSDRHSRPLTGALLQKQVQRLGAESVHIGRLNYFYV